MRSVTVAILAFLGMLALSGDAARSFEMPLTPREKMVMLERVAKSSASCCRLGVPAVANPALPNDYRSRYMATGLGGRVSIAKKIGGEGVERYAAQNRLKTLLGVRGARSVRGPDSVYWDRATGRVVVLEAKGGSSPLKWTYDSRQGTNVNTIRSAEGVLSQRSTTAAEKLAAARAVRAARGGRLETRVIRTPHVLGTPGRTTLEGRPDVANVRKGARDIEQRAIRKRPELRSVFRRAGRRAVLGQFLHAGSRVMLPAAVVVSGATIGVASYRFVTGAVGYREFSRDSADSAFFLAFTAGGAVIGGLSFFGVGTAPGAAIGGLIAVPAQFAYDWFTELHRADFDKEQRAAIDRAVEVRYFGNMISFR